MLYLFYGVFFVKIFFTQYVLCASTVTIAGPSVPESRRGNPPPDFGRDSSKIFSFKMHWINAHPSPKFSDLPTALYRLYRVVDSSSFYSSQRKASAFFLESYMHRVDITESFSAQYPTWIFNFGPYGQLSSGRQAKNAQKTSDVICECSLMKHSYSI